MRLPLMVALFPTFLVFKIIVFRIFSSQSIFQQCITIFQDCYAFWRIWPVGLARAANTAIYEDIGLAEPRICCFGKIFNLPAGPNELFLKILINLFA